MTNEKRIHEIEYAVSQGRMSAMECFTQMRQLIPRVDTTPTKMRRGKTERETLNLNGWGAGNVLEGAVEGESTRRIVITMIRGDQFFCRWSNGHGGWLPESFNTTLSCREWRKVGEAVVGSLSAEILCDWSDSSRDPQ